MGVFWPVLHTSFPKILGLADPQRREDVAMTERLLAGSALLGCAGHGVELFGGTCNSFIDVMIYNKVYIMIS